MFCVCLKKLNGYDFGKISIRKNNSLAQMLNNMTFHYNVMPGYGFPKVLPHSPTLFNDWYYIQYLTEHCSTKAYFHSF